MQICLRGEECSTEIKQHGDIERTASSHASVAFETVSSLRSRTVITDAVLPSAAEE